MAEHGFEVGAELVDRISPLVDGRHGPQPF
jgi:hypothetical protein